MQTTGKHFLAHDALNQFEILLRVTVGAIDIRDADAAQILADACEGVADIDHALFNNGKIDPGAPAGEESLDHVRTVEANAKLEARQAGLRDFDHRSTHAVVVSEEGVFFEKPFGGEVFSEAPPGKFEVRQLPAPVIVMLGGIRVDRFVLSAMNGEIRLKIAIEIQAAKKKRARHRRFENAGGHLAALGVAHDARHPDVERDDFHMLQSRTAEPLMWSLFRSFSARLASRRGYMVVCE